MINPIITWNGVIVDGHNRYHIVSKHPHIQFTTCEKAFIDRYEAIAWICKNQLGRRNLTLNQKKYLIGKQYEVEKQRQGTNNQYIQAKSESSQIGNFHSTEKTCDRIAKENSISKNSVLRAEAYSKAVDIADEIEPGIRAEFLNGSIRATEKEIHALARADPEDRPAIIEEIRKPPDDKKKLPNIPIGKPLTKVEQASADMLAIRSKGTVEDMLYELEDSLDSLMFRWTMCLSNNRDYFSDEKYRSQIHQLAHRGLNYLQKILIGEIPK